MENRNLEEALKTVEGIKEFFEERTRRNLLETKFQFLVWGTYQLLAPIIVYFTKNWLYFLLLLPIFFFLSFIRTGKVFLNFAYWLLTFILYISILKFTKDLRIFLIVVGLTLFLAPVILFERHGKTEKFLSLFWANTILFGLLLQTTAITMKAFDLLYFTWPGIIIFALGCIGILGEISLFYLSIIANVIGGFYFSLTGHDLRIFTTSIYGLLYILYYLYVSLKLKKQYGSTNS